MIIDLETSGYEGAYRIQRDLVKRRILGEIEDSCIVVEHLPIFTIGRSCRIEESILNRNEIGKHKIRVLGVDRGGNITFHGPGQLVIYPIIDLKARGRDLHKYMRDLEELVIKFLREYSVTGERIKGKTGVWVKGSKIAFIGIAASNWVTYHGVSINLNVDLGFFSMITPCGIKDINVGNLSDLVCGDIDMTEARRRILYHFGEIFGVARNSNVTNCALVG